MAINLDKLKGKLEQRKKEQAEAAEKKAWHKLKEGKNIIRLLPPPDGIDEPWAEGRFHYNIIDKQPKRGLMCAQTFGKPCPICEVSDKLKEGSKEDRNKGYKINAKSRFYANILDVEKPEKAKKFAFGVTLRDWFLSLIADDEYGDITDPKKGINLKIDKTGENMDTEYTDLVASRKSTEVPNWDEIKKGLFDHWAKIKEDELSYEVLNEALETGVMPGETEKAETTDKTGEFDKEEEEVESPEDEFATSATATVASTETKTVEVKSETKPAAEVKVETKDEKRTGNIQATLERLKAKAAQK